MIKYISIIFSALLLAGCEKTVNLSYKSNQSRIVIEGNITNEPGPYFVKISRSVGLTDAGNNPAIDDAIVAISDDAGNREMLTPQGNGIYHTTALEGVMGRTYTLTIQAENQTYTAQSTMPQLVSFDSIKAETFTFGGETEFNIIPIYIDPLTKGNYYRFVLSVNNVFINQHFVHNDDVINGTANTVRLEIDDNTLKLKAGDQVSLQMQNIDKNVGLYYSTLALMGDSGPGGGTTPNNPPTNISNGALGIFSAHTVQVKNTVLP
jgi:hypothetical protein